MNRAKNLGLLFISFLLFSACSQDESPLSVSEQMEGIELKLSLDKQEYSLEEEVVATVSITNHNDESADFFVPIPIDFKEGIAGVSVEHQNELMFQLLSPKTDMDISNIVGRSYYDFVYVQLEPKETVEQEFVWNQDLINQESHETTHAGTGDYLISTFILLDEIDEQLEYFEPNNQLISKITFSVNN